jgi:hypothetical protein
MTINVAAAPMPCSSPEQNSALLPCFTSEPSGPLSSNSPDSKGSRSFCTRSPRRTSLPRRPLSLQTFLVHSPRSTRLEKPSDGHRCNLSLPEPTRARRPNLRRSPRQRSTRSRRTVGDMSMDWIVPKSSTTPVCSKGICKAPIRTMQTLASASMRSGWRRERARRDGF